MQTTGIFSLHTFEIQVAELNKPIYLLPMGDVHKFSPQHHAEKWKETLDWAAQKERVIILGMGDYMDIGSTSERRILLNQDLHDGTTKTLEELYLEQTMKFAKDLEPFKGRIIGLIEGNHYGQFCDGTTSTQKLCNLLSCKYLGVATFIRLSFVMNLKHAVVDIFAHHGKGAARLIGGDLNRIQQMGEQAQADVYLMGHSHKKNVGMTTKLALSAGRGGELKLRQRKQVYARTGGFLKGYEDGEPSYIVDACMNPTDLGIVKVELTPKRHQKEVNGEVVEDYFYVDIHASI